MNLLLLLWHPVLALSKHDCAAIASVSNFSLSACGCHAGFSYCLSAYLSVLCLCLSLLICLTSAVLLGTCPVPCSHLPAPLSKASSFHLPFKFALIFPVLPFKCLPSALQQCVTAWLTCWPLPSSAFHLCCSSLWLFSFPVSPSLQAASTCLAAGCDYMTDPVQGATSTFRV